MLIHIIKKKSTYLFNFKYIHNIYLYMFLYIDNNTDKKKFKCHRDMIPKIECIINMKHPMNIQGKQKIVVIQSKEIILKLQIGQVKGFFHLKKIFTRSIQTLQKYQISKLNNSDKNMKLMFKHTLKLKFLNLYWSLVKLDFPKTLLK